MIWFAGRRRQFFWRRAVVVSRKETRSYIRGMEDELVPELGDWVTIISDAYKTTSGRIIFRDGALIRIRPTQSSNTGVDFPLDPETGLFQEALGVQEILIHEKRKNPHFATQLSVVEGEVLEFFSLDGTPIGEGVVARIVVTDEEDGIILADGKELNFQFIGSAPPIDIIRPRAAPENVADEENNSSSNAESVEEEEEPEVFPELDYTTLPAALVEEIPSEERTFSDSVQREDMFVSLLVDIPFKKQRDPKVMQNLYRITDLLLALKNSVVVRDEAGAIRPGSTSYVVDTLQDILERNRSGDSLRAFLPVMAVKKVLYTDDKEPFETDDTESRSDVGTLATVAGSENIFLKQDPETAFAGYIHSVLQTIQAYVPATASRSRIPYDMDVLRSQVPPKPVIGFLEVPPTVNKKNEPQTLSSEALSTINDRYVRLLSASYLRNYKTGTMTVVAPADSGDVLQHIILSRDMLRFRSPIRSSILLWDIAASEASRSSRSLFYTTLMKNWAAQEFYDPDNVLSLSEFLADRLPASTSFNEEHLTTVMDSLGLRNLEIPTTAFEPIAAVVQAGIAKWNNQYAALIKAAAVAAGLKSVPAIPSLLNTDSALLTVLNSEPVKPVLESLTENETLLKTYDFTIVNGFGLIANKTFGPYYYALAGGVDSALTTAVGNTYKAESQRIERNTKTARDSVNAFQAAPIINPCKHVKELERIMNIGNDENRMLLFEKFLNQYQAGQRGNFIMCGACGKDLICKHEVLLLNEFLHPGRSQALHKALLLEYAGPVFEGAYICKSCGQKIQDLEYDTHLEFDDEGRPLVGRNVLAAEEDDETAPGIAFGKETKADNPFGTEADMKLYSIARTIFERCGYAAPLDTYKRVINATQDYLKLRVPDRIAYEKVTGAAAKGKKPVAVASYDTFFANNQIGIIGAFVVLEIQTSEINVPFPAAGCEYSRAGFPLDGDDPAVAGRGALAYVSCGIANIFRNDAPWNLTSWSPETQMPKRLNAAENAVRLSLFSILCISSGKSTPAPLTNVTDTYKTLLENARKKETAEVVKASEMDRLPPAFRPMAVPADRSLMTEESIQNVKKFQADVATMPVATIGPFVRARGQQLNAQLVGQFYKESIASAVIIENSPRSDSVCCFGRLGDVARVGVGVRSLGLENLSAELEIQTAAAVTVARRDSAAPNCGSHIYVPWSAATRIIDLAELDSSGYYKLFLQYCYRGVRDGGIHEFNVSGVCRWCRYAMPAELMDLTIGDITEMGGRRQRMIDALNARREEIAKDGLRRQNISFDEAGFRRLENAMKNFKAIAPPAPPATADFINVLTTLGRTLGMLLPSAAGGWSEFVTAMKAIRDETPADDVERSGKLYQFSLSYDASLQSLLLQMTKGLGADGCDRLLKRVGKQFGIESVQRGPEAKIGAAVELLGQMFDAISESEDGITILRNYLDIFVKEGTQIRYSYMITKPDGSKWFPKISRNHNGLLATIWTASFGSVTKATNALSEYSPETIEIAHKSLDRFTTWFSMWLSVIRDDIRSGVQLTTKEFRLMIQWSLFNALLALFSEESPMYADASDSVKKVEATKFHILWVCDAMISGIELIRKYQKTPEQIQEAITARAELEKAYFIKKFDDLDKDLKDVEKRKMALKIGDWAVGTLKNLFSYDADFFEFERGQRAAMGLPEFSGDITGLAEAEPARRPVMEEGYDHRAPADEDVD